MFVCVCVCVGVSTSEDSEGYSALRRARGSNLIGRHMSNPIMLWGRARRLGGVSASEELQMTPSCLSHTPFLSVSYFSPDSTLSLPLHLSHSLSLSFSLSVPLHISHSLSLSFSLSVPLHLSHSLSLSFSLSLPLHLSHSLSLFLTLRSSPSLSLTLSLFLTLRSSLRHSRPGAP